MPYYDYECLSKDCGMVTEILHGILETPNVHCKYCGNPSRVRIAPVPAAFKGSGWAKDNYSSTTK